MEFQQPCKEWTGARSPKGYGVKRYKGAARRVHRVAWEENVGPIPEGMWVLHHCDNPPCYEITHLYLGTGADNARDKVERHRQATRETNPNAKLTATEVAAIRTRYAAGGVKQRELAAEYGVTQYAISFILGRAKTGKPRCTPEEVAEIRAAVAAGETQRSVARQFDLNPTSVGEIVRGLTHRSAAS